jgi:pimeloyl-ACP methyl ester carboxylesterase
MSADPSVRVAMERLLECSGAAWRSVWTEQSGDRLHHLEAGSGPALVLIHGGSGGGANWFRVLGGLAQRYRVCAVDLPGFGLSDPIEPRGPLGRTAAVCLLSWMERNGLERATVAGTSFGGLAALRLAQATDLVTRLLLLDSAGLGRGMHPTVRVAVTGPVTALAVRPTRRGTAELFRRLLTANLGSFPPEEQELLIDYLYATSVSAGTAYLSSTLRLFAGPRGQREVLTAGEMAGLGVPTMVVWGERDRLLPLRHAHRAASLIPGARLEIIGDSGHSPNWESPHRVMRAIDTLVTAPPSLA